MLGTDADSGSEPPDDSSDPAVMARLMEILGDDAPTWLSDKEVFTPEEVAKRMRVEVHTVRRLLREGDLGGFKIGGRWKVPAKSITDYLAERWSG